MTFSYHYVDASRDKRDVTQMARMLECLTGKYGFDLIDYGCFCGLGDYGEYRVCQSVVHTCTTHE